MSAPREAPGMFRSAASAARFIGLVVFIGVATQGLIWFPALVAWWVER